MAERPAWFRARVGRVAIRIGLLMCVPGVVGVVLGFILREHNGATVPLWSPYRAINLPIWMGLLFLAGGIGYIVWGSMRLRSLR
jgi:tryptophan-rich sensory protein